MFKKDPCLNQSHSPHSPHLIIPKYIKDNSLVLDVGCNTGFMGKVLIKRGCISDGVDINTEALKKAKKYYSALYKRDLYIGKLHIPSKKYDYIIFADVLEHLPRPDLLLKDATKYLKKSGYILISLPNIARLEIRAQLLFGKFDYTYGGILSEDHLRHFTKKQAVKMISECGLRTNQIIPTGIGHKIRIFPTLTAFQFVYVCNLK